MTLVDLIGIAREFRPDLTIRRLPRWLMLGMADPCLGCQPLNHSLSLRLPDLCR